jgi:ATP-dependent DNA helicase RecG
MPNLITLDTKLALVSGIAPKTLAHLKKLGLETVRSLLWHFPTRYEDYTKITKIADLKVGEMVTVRGEIRHVAVKRAWKSYMPIVEATVVDETGGITLVWFNQPFMAKALHEGQQANFAGKVFSNKTGIHLSNPSYEVLRGTTVATHTAGLIPVYPETRGLTSKGIRFVIKQFLEILPKLEDFVPESILKQHDLPSLDYALRHIHFPHSTEQVQRAKARFAFEFVFLLQLTNLQLRSELALEKAPVLTVSEPDLNTILASLPFTLTETQRSSLDEILDDLKRGMPMNRLLQGDVGSGKTAVAAIAAVVTAHCGSQTVFMAPTEVLARQHYQTLTGIFKNFNNGIALLTGSEARVYYDEHMEEKVSKTKIADLVARGELSIVIGTHALIAKDTDKKKKVSGLKLKFSKLGLVIIDEQHRFGVRQRQSLSGRAEHKTKTTVSGLSSKQPVPHFLSMSATPIPRTLSLAIFGDLDVSTINELPKGRKAIITKIVDPTNRPKAYGFLKQQITAGRQAFFIYPRIETDNSQLITDSESQNSPVISHKLSVNGPDEVRAVKAEYERLSKIVFPDLSVAMLHGKMKPAEKTKVMADFKSGKTDILVSTSVIEVGVDVPNATIMVIEGAERFGLAQLYQFRGRVGRGEHQSFCFLFTDSTAETTATRLNALIEARNGFELAEKDLEIRGPGQFLGDKQTGVPDVAMDSLSDVRLVKAARDSAQQLLTEDPSLSTHPPLKAKLDEIKNKVHLE